MQYLALLRGINVGGNNIISKGHLKALFEGVGLKDVTTYIQSGNIIFQSDQRDEQKLVASIQQALFGLFGKTIPTLVLSQAHYQKILSSLPDNWGQEDSKKHDALFILPGFELEQIEPNLPPVKPEIEARSLTPSAIFYSVDKSKASRSSLVSLPKLEIYKAFTIRNHNTVFKLGGLLQA